MKRRVVFKLPNAIYSMAFFIYTLYNVLGTSMLMKDVEVYPSLNMPVTVCSAFLVLIAIILKNRINGWYLIAGCILSGVAAIAFIWMGSAHPVIISILLVGAYFFEAKSIIRAYFASTGIVVLVSMILAILGVIEDRIMVTYRGNGMVYERHAMGLTYTTVFAAIASFLMAALLYKRSKAVGAIPLCLFMAGTITVYFLTNARIELVVCIALFLCILLEKKKHFIQKMKYAAIFAFPISYFIAFFTMMWYVFKWPFYEELDAFFTTRLSLSALGFARYGLTPFGTSFRMQGYGGLEYDADFGYFFIDSFYINYTLQYGVVFMVLLMGIVVWMSFKLYKNKCYWELLFLCFAEFHGIIISSIIMPYMSPFLYIAMAKCGEVSRRKALARSEDPNGKRRLYSG